MASPTIRIPPSTATVSVTAFDISEEPSAICIPAPAFYTPVLPGHEILHLPIFAFLIEHTATGRRVMFDLGPRKDLENAAPAVVEMFKTLPDVAIPIERDVVEQLQDHGVDLNSINAVIWSHAHYDHTGDVSKFPPSTDLVYGAATVTDTHTVNSASVLLDSDFAGRKSVPINFDETSLEIGGFKAHDFFGDGSLYILDVPGHLKGHICALARVTPDSFVFMGGDACHHAGMLRPTSILHQRAPCPADILEATRHSVSAAHFTPLDAEGKFDLAARTAPMLDFVPGMMYEDPVATAASIALIGAFDASSDVLVVLAHDWSLVPAVGPFPTSLDAWKAKGSKELVTWAFLEESNPAFVFSPKTVRPIS
ncbi:beta-lactamase-like protein [Mycena alexandri]|uniref:Beta-lactamase-like protein n=1 Tax=Mycena alexandri TaxID=1745969 RepID=A0AAD6XA88_9AGAR|nr:beta-lactamase-like protein [Mycena alexandri]